MGTQEQEMSIYLTEEEYLIQELKAEFKSEYDNGKVVAMAGAKDEHNLIVSNLIYELNKCARGNNCLVYPSDMLLKLKHCNTFVYPDVMMVCDKKQIEKKAKNGSDALLNPTVIVEVLSKSTRRRDEVVKRDCYLELKGVKQYILVDSLKKDITMYSKNNQEEWVIKKYKSENDTIEVENCAISISDIYRNIEFS